MDVSKLTSVAEFTTDFLRTYRGKKIVQRTWASYLKPESMGDENKSICESIDLRSKLYIYCLDNKLNSTLLPL